MDKAFEVQSPLGYVVGCTRDRYDDHILDGHSKLKGQEDEVAKSIADPLFVYQSKSHDSRHVYFKEAIDYLRRPFHERFMKTVVDQFSPTEGRVVTAFYSPEIKGNIKEDGLLYAKTKLR